MKNSAVLASLVTCLLAGCSASDKNAFDQLASDESLHHKHVQQTAQLSPAEQARLAAEANQPDLALPSNGPKLASMPLRPAAPAGPLLQQAALAPNAGGTSAIGPLANPGPSPVAAYAAPASTSGKPVLTASAAIKGAFPTPPPAVSPEDRMVMPETTNIPVPFASPNDKPLLVATAYAATPTGTELAALQKSAPTTTVTKGVEVAYATQQLPEQPQGLEKYRSMSDFATGMDFDTSAPVQLDKEGSGSSLDKLIKKYAELYEVPLQLVHRVVKRESGYNPRAFAHGNYGLMQIRYRTAKGLGYEGPAEGLFDAETNLKYAVKYLRGALLVADNSNDAAVRLYARGYYWDAKRKGLLDEIEN